MRYAPLVDENSNLWLFSPEQRVSEIPVRSWEIPFDEPVPEPFAVPDFESYFSKKYAMGPRVSPWEYVQNPAFNPYLVSLLIVRGRGRATVIIGPPGQVPWEQADGLTWVSHSAGFDELVFRKCLALGIIRTASRPRQWECTLDMLAWMQCRKALADACLDLLRVAVDKSTRDRLRGGGDSVPDEELTRYIYHDAYWCAVLWCRFNHHWPEHERMLSRQTRRLGWFGVYTDEKQLRLDIAHLERSMTEIAKTIPWLGGKRSIISLDELNKQCDREGILRLASLDLDNLQTIKWDRIFGQTRPWLHTIKRYTRARQTKTFFEMLLARRRCNGTVPFTLKYCKAPHTHRWQSGEGLRLQNLDIDECEGINIRHRFQPRPGELFIIADCTQIEPRVLNWLAGNTEFLAACAAGMSPYEAHARQAGYTGPGPLKKVDPPAYALYKAQTLALGYQAGAPKFVTMAREYCKLFLHESERTALLKVNGRDIWFAEKDLNKARAGIGDRNLIKGLAAGEVSIFPPALDVVRVFRLKATKIRNYWYQCEREMRRDIGGHHFVHLPCGTIRYFDVEDTDDGMKARIVYKSEIPSDRRHFYGGKLAENRVQFVARCILGEILLRLRQMPVGKLNWHVHDETISRVPARQAEEMRAWHYEQFTRPIPWAPDLPLAAEVRISDKYDK